MLRIYYLHLLTALCSFCTYSNHGFYSSDQNQIFSLFCTIRQEKLFTHCSTHSLYSLPSVLSTTGKIYAVGGSDGTNLSSAECYNISTKTWSLISPMATARKFPGVETLSGCVYAIGGSHANPSTRKHGSVEKYIPSLNQWLSVASLITPRSGLCTVVLEGCIFALGGHDGSAPLSSVEKYDPLMNEWTAQPHMNLARDCASAAVVQVEVGGSGGQNRGGSPAVLGGSSNRTSPDNGATSPVIN